MFNIWEHKQQIHRFCSNAAQNKEKGEVVAIIFSPGVNEAISHAQKHLAKNISVAKNLIFSVLKAPRFRKV